MILKKTRSHVTSLHYFSWLKHESQQIIIRVIQVNDEIVTFVILEISFS